MLKLNLNVKIMFQNIIYGQVKSYKFYVDKVVVVFEVKLNKKGFLDKKFMVGKKGKMVISVKNQKKFFMGGKVLVIKKLVVGMKLVEQKFSKKKRSLLYKINLFIL